MKAHVLCIDDNSPRLMDRRKCLEEAGFTVLSARDASQAVHLLKSHPVDVVCVGSGFVDNAGTAVSANIKSIQPDVPIVLIRDRGAIPASLQEQVDLVTDGRDFDARAQWLIEQLHGGQTPFFLQWFGDWSRRASESTNSEPLRIC